MEPAGKNDRPVDARADIREAQQMPPFQLSDRQGTWLNALLVLGTLALALVCISLLASVFFAFGDVLLVFFLAWLLAFILSPVVSSLTRAIPLLPRVAAVVLVYTALAAGFIVLVVLIAGALAGSIVDFIESVPSIQQQLPRILADWQAWLVSLGLPQIDLVAQAEAFLGNLVRYADQLVGPIQSVAVASLGAIGTLLIIVLLSLYMVVDSEAIMSFLFRLIPPSRKDEARLLETSVAHSFGGFLRGQAILGVVYAAIAAVTSAILGLDYLAVSSAAAGVLMAIPFFGPFIAWLPPVAVALVTQPESVVPAFILMGIGWLLVMNVLQPRLMQEAVGIHPIVVLGSILVGAKIAGIAGIVFGIPIAAVISAFFMHFLAIYREPAPVTERAAKRVEAREGRPIRIPREPAPGVDSDVT